MKDNYIDNKLINNILDECMKSGDFAEVFVEDRYNTQIELTDGKIGKGLSANEFGIGIRVFSGCSYVYTYVTGAHQEELMKAARKLSTILKGSSHAGVAVKAEPENVSRGAEIYFDRVDYGRKVDILRQVQASGLSYSQLIRRMSVKYVDQIQRVLVANSEGLYRSDERIKTRLMVTAFAEKDGIVRSGYIGPGAAKGFEYYESADLAGYGREAARGAVDMLPAIPCPSGRMTVVVDNGFGGLLFHEACGHSLEARGIAEGNSEFAGKLGSPIASEVVTLIDDGSITGEWGYCNMDDEGISTRKNVLIEKGVLKSYLTDRLSARKMNTAPNGCGRRESYKFPASSRMSNTYIASGNSKREDIISNTEKGLFVKSINAGSVNPLTGEFNFSVQESYLIEGGKITLPVYGATLIGKGGEVLMNVDMVGDNLSLGQGFCYSDSGALYIDAGQPTVRVSAMTVGGVDK